MIAIALFNVRSLYNVGAIMRSAAAFGIKELWTIGITPHAGRESLPHIQDKERAGLAKTALGAEKILRLRHFDNLKSAIEFAKNSDLTVVALEQSPNAVAMTDFTAPKNMVLFVGPERYGFSRSDLRLFDKIVEITLQGQKSSLNVAAASAVALFEATRSDL